MMNKNNDNIGSWWSCWEPEAENPKILKISGGGCQSHLLTGVLNHWHKTWFVFQNFVFDFPFLIYMYHRVSGFGVCPRD